MRTEKIEIIFKSTSFEELDSKHKKLVLNARESYTHAYAPYSGFLVGSSVLLENGEIVNASNQENVAYPSGLCAERIALFYAGSRYPDVSINAITVSATSKSFKLEGLISPCGGCRQVMAEYEEKQDSNIKVLLDCSDSILIIDSVKDLLPLLFKLPLLKRH